MGLPPGYPSLQCWGQPKALGGSGVLTLAGWTLSLHMGPIESEAQEPGCMALGERPGGREAGVPGDRGEVEPLLQLEGDSHTAHCMG